MEWKWEGDVVDRAFVYENRQEPSLTKVKYSEKGKETNIPDDCDMVMTYLEKPFRIPSGADCMLAPTG